MKLYSLNTRGLSDKRKRRTILQWVKSNYKGIVYLQETHSTKISETLWKRDWSGEMHFSHGTCGSRGVAIIFPPNCNVTIHDKITDTLGRLYY